jgi:hypothetical protein
MNESLPDIARPIAWDAVNDKGRSRVVFDQRMSVCGAPVVCVVAGTSGGRDCRIPDGHGARSLPRVPIETAELQIETQRWPPLAAGR